MPAPFPGMNPYLEQGDVWQDFHQSFIPLIRGALAAQVRPGYVVKIEEQIFIHELAGEDRHLLGRPDLGIFYPLPKGKSSGSALLPAPAYGKLPMTVDVERHSYLEVRDRIR